MNQTTTTSQIIPIKVGIFGNKGSGKSTTGALIASALSAQFYNRAPVYVLDPEADWQFLEKRIFNVEGIKLHRGNYKSFKGMMQSLREAEKLGCCAWLVDPLTPIWSELLEAYQKKTNGYMDYGDWADLKGMWREYVDFFLNTKMNTIALGRLGDETEEVQDEKNPEKTKRVKVGTKFKAGGGESFGYEPHLLLEMSLERKPKHLRGSKLEGEGRMIHRADVIKDRTWELNGKILRWSDKDGYQKGGYRAVWESLKPHFNFVQSTATHPQISQESSADLLSNDGRSEYYVEQRSRKQAVEEFDGIMDLLLGGRDAKSIRLRALVGEAITGTLSKSKMEEELTLEQLKHCVDVMVVFRQRVNDEGWPATEKDVLQLVELAKLDIESPCNPSAGKTLLQVLGEQSVEKIRPGSSAEFAQAAKRERIATPF